MRTYRFLVVALLTLAGCSEDESTPTGTVDTGTSTTDTAVISDTAKEDTSAADSAKAETTADSGTETLEDTAKDTPLVCEIGMMCNDMQPCPGTLRCYGTGGNGFCAYPEPECGGFVMKICAGGRTCLRASGSLGYCATPDEKPCICASDAGYTTDGC